MVLRSMLVGLDDSPASAAAVELGLRWARRLDARLAVGTDRSAAGRHAARAVEFLHAHGIGAVACPAIASAAPDRVLLEEARQGDTGLLVMGAYGRSRLRAWLRGSRTRTLRRESPVPLLLCH